MARVYAYAPLNLVNPAIWYGEIIRATSTEIAISDGYNTAVYRGHGFTYAGDYIIGGQLTGYSQYAGGALLGEAFDISMPAVSAANFILNGNTQALLQIALSGDDIIVTSDYDDALAGYGGNDVFSPGLGNNYVHGGEGIDTVILRGSGGDYTISGNNLSINLNRKDGLSNNVLQYVERMQFDNGTLAVDFHGVAGQAYRLYQAAFDRTPDTEGLSYWIKEMDKGVSLRAVADSFLASPEFVSTYGTEQTVSNSRYVELLYTHTLGRNYDQGGFRYWVERLDANATNRADLLAFFSESDENFNRTIGAIDDGIWFV